MTVGPVAAVEGSPRVRALLAEAASIYVSGCAAEITAAPEILGLSGKRDAIVTGIFSPLVNHRSYADPATGRRVRSFLMTKALKRSLAEGLVDLCPWRYSVIDRWLSASNRFDAALIMMSPPDRNGRCSLGVQTDFFPRFAKKVGKVIGFINPRMPVTGGDAAIDYSSIAAVVDYDVPLLELAPRLPDATTVAIADRIVELVGDRATVQFGVGQIPSQVLGRLTAHRGLRIHSGVIDDNVLALEAAGALDADAPIVTGTAVGTTALYERLSDQRRFSFRAVSYTHNHRTIAEIPGFTAINSVLRADLFGQVSAEIADGRVLATPGGLPDFVRGALDSAGGTSIIALRARRVSEAHSGGIVASLGSPGLATIGATDADVVVTEFGVARLRSLPFDQRAEAMIAIAAPEDQDELRRSWAEMRASGLAPFSHDRARRVRVVR